MRKRDTRTQSKGPTNRSIRVQPLLEPGTIHQQAKLIINKDNRLFNPELKMRVLLAVMSRQEDIKKGKARLNDVVTEETERVLTEFRTEIKKAFRPVQMSMQGVPSKWDK